MNNERVTALLEWINSVSGVNVLFIRDFSTVENVKLLVKTIHLIDKDSDEVLPGYDDATVEGLVGFIISSLEGIYRQKLDGIVINPNLITVDADEVEIGKVIALMLSAAVQCENANYFVKKIQSFEESVQYQIKEIIETLLQQVEHGGLDASAITKLLKHTTGKNKEKQELPAGTDCVESPLPGKSPTETLFSSSPFLSLMSSPQLKTKQHQFTMNKLHQKVSKLQLSLDAQMHMQATLEEELADKCKEIDVKDTKMKELNKDVVHLKMVIDELESTQHYKADYEKLERESERMKQRVAELEAFREQSCNLDERMADFLEKKAMFKKSVEDMEQLKTKCERYKSQLHEHEFKASELKAALERRVKDVERLEKERDEALFAASEAMELWKARKSVEIPDEEERDGSPVDTQHTNLDSRIIELEFTNEKLRAQLASAIDPSEVQRLNDALEDAEQSKRSYETIRNIDQNNKLSGIEFSSPHLGKVLDRHRFLSMLIPLQTHKIASACDLGMFFMVLPPARTQESQSF
ncbi:predicted protein [Nematostella vectensis]|uniref:Nuclear mitotic apparatus protein 1 N-terminal hook domain-containing protein n=1 Tax=Nematostella vectensis TaxID=45351 RepID=A7RFI1_NEMVE|nr:predicted protein [Nematostella vectensis]|eukprot:XP_001641668.1 predicted protein [Nematostella vectensis]